MYPNFKKVWSKTTKSYIYSIVIEYDNEENIIPSFISLWVHNKIKNLDSYTYQYAIVYNIQENSYRINSIRYIDIFKFLIAASKKVKNKVVLDKFLKVCSKVISCIK